MRIAVIGSRDIPDSVRSIMLHIGLHSLVMATGLLVVTRMARTQHGQKEATLLTLSVSSSISLGPLTIVITLWREIRFYNNPSQNGLGQQHNFTPTGITSRKARKD